MRAKLWREHVIVGLIFLVTGGFSRAVTLAEYAREKTLVIQAVSPGEQLSFGKVDQVNNLKEGANVLRLSGLGLTSVEGIASLTVLSSGKPTPITQVPELQIFLNENQIETMPEEFATLDQVTFIYLNGNRIRTIPPAVSRMKSLQGMYFTANQLTEIPPYIFTMHGLRKFQLSQNRVKEIPSDFGKLVNLIHLNLAENEIERLPDSMANLTQLRVCDLSDNRLTKLPDSFGRVQILYQLRVRNNPLTSLPEGFAAMPGTIDITGTKIQLQQLSPALRAKVSTEKPAVKPKVIVRPKGI